MAKRILFLGFLILASAFAHSAPSVWDQMQYGQTSSVRGVVKAVDIMGSDIYIKVETKDAFGDPTVRNDRLCRSTDGLEDSRDSEEIRATLLKSKIDMLQEARRTGRAIEYGTLGVWKPCVSFLRSLDS